MKKLSKKQDRCESYLYRQEWSAALTLDEEGWVNGRWPESRSISGWVGTSTFILSGKSQIWLGCMNGIIASSMPVRTGKDSTILLYLTVGIVSQGRGGTSEEHFRIEHWEWCKVQKTWSVQADWKKFA